MLEKDIIRKALAWARTQPDIFAFKAAAGPFQVRGIADIVGHVRGEFLWAECKRPGGHLTPHQASTARRVRETGAIPCVFTTLDEFKAHVDELRVVSAAGGGHP